MIKRIENIKKVAIALAILFITLIAILLILRGCYDEGGAHGSVNIPGNVIDNHNPMDIAEANLEFGSGDAEENRPFAVEKMDSGSASSIIYRVVATYNSDFILKYHMKARENEEFLKLAQIMRIKAELVGENESIILYDGLLSSMPTLDIEMKTQEEKTTEYLFRITMYLDAPLTEEYYGQRLISDMSWWIEDQDSIGIANCEFSTVSEQTLPVRHVDLSFIQVNEGDNTSFDMKNLKNGDSQSRYFAFEVSHVDEVTLLINNTVALDTSLGEVLKVKAELLSDGGNIIIYEGKLKDLSAEHTVSPKSSGKTRLYYKVTVTADGLTEAYCQSKLVCDLSWSIVKTNECLKIPNNTFVDYGKPYTPPNPPKPPETATSIELTAKDGYDNLPFDLKNILPGDSEEKYYCVSVTHDKANTVCFSITVDVTQKLSNVLRVKVEQLIPDEKDKVLYDGLMKDCDCVDVNVSTKSQTVTPIYYRITVYTNGAEVGNEYVGSSLTADFSWQLQ